MRALKHAHLVSSVALTLLVSIGCRKAGQPNKYDASTIDTTPVDGGTYIDASIADAAILNPLLSTESVGNDIIGQVFNGLVKYDKDIKLTGDLAEKWEVADAGKIITFHLRKGVRWHDGKPFTSADALFTYQMLVDSNTNTPFADDFKLVDHAEAPDDYTFRVVYKEPFAPAVESWGIGIIPKHIYERTDINTNPANKAPIGTGPYRFISWKTDEKIELRANPDYFEGRPHLERYIYRIIPDPSVQFLELRQGSLSGMSPTPDQYNGYPEFFWAYNKYKYPAFRYDFIAFNLQSELFKDVRVRRALAHAINKKEIIDGVYQGLATSATGPFPLASWAYNPDVKDIPYDLNEARRLLADAGWKDSDGDGILDKDGKPLEFRLLINQGNRVREAIGQIAQNSLARIGVKVDLVVLEWTVFLTQYVNKGNFDACVLGWSLSRDPDNYIIWHSGKSQYNFIGYANPEVDRLLIEGRKTFGVEKRQPIYRKIHQLIADDVPYIFLTYPMSLPVVHKKILGVELAPAGIGWNFIRWYIPKAWQDKTGYAAN